MITCEFIVYAKQRGQTVRVKCSDAEAVYNTLCSTLENDSMYNVMVIKKTFEVTRNAGEVRITTNLIGEDFMDLNAILKYKKG